MPANVEYVISILKQGEGASEAVSDFSKVKNAAETANNAIVDSSNKAATATVSAQSRIRSSISLLSIAFPQATAAATQFGSAVTLIRGALPSVGLTAIGVASSIALIGTAAVTAGFAISALNAAMVEFQTSEDLAVQTTKGLVAAEADLEARIQAGEFSAEGAAKRRAELEAIRRMVENPPPRTFWEALMGKPEDFTQASVRLRAFNTETRDMAVTREKLARITTDAQLDMLSGLDRELQAIDNVTAARLKEVEAISKASGASKEQVEATIKNAGAIQRARAQLEASERAADLTARIQDAALGTQINTQAQQHLKTLGDINRT